MPRAAHASTGTEHHPAAVVEVADHLVAGDEGERHDRFEVAAGMTVDGGQVAAADAGEPGPDPLPARRRAARAGRCPSGPAGPYAAPRPGTSRPATAAAAYRRGLRLYTSAFTASRLHGFMAHRGTRLPGRRGASGSGLSGAPAILDHCSTNHPRLRAMAASRVSGLTATGNPTASSSGRSDDESAYATDSARSMPSAAAKSKSTDARASPVGGTAVSSPE